MLEGLASLAMSVYAIYRYNSASGTPSQRRAQRESWNKVMWGGIAGAFMAPAAGGAAAGGGTGAASTTTLTGGSAAAQAANAAGFASTAGTTAGTGAGAAAGTAAATGQTVGAGATVAGSAGLTATGPGTYAMGMTVTAPMPAAAVPAVVASTAPQTIAGPAIVGGAYGVDNLVYGDPPKETWWQKMEGRGQTGEEKGSVKDWMDDIGTPQQQKEEEETPQPSGPQLDYYAIAAERDREKREAEMQQEPMPEGGHGARRWDDWAHNDWWGV